MTERIINEIKTKYNLVPQDPGEYSKLKAKGMKFDINAYKAEGLGWVSVMKAKGFFGLMKMDTVIVVPEDTDLPLYSYDRINAMGNDTLIVELYDTMLGDLPFDSLESVKSRYADVPERDPGIHWYDSIKLESSISKKLNTPRDRLDSLALEHLAAYLALPSDPVADKEAKRLKSKVYVEGLLENGGPSTDVFKSEIGEERTAYLFRNVLFGTGK